MLGIPRLVGAMCKVVACYGASLQGFPSAVRVRYMLCASQEMAFEACDCLVRLFYSMICLGACFGSLATIVARFDTRVTDLDVALQPCRPPESRHVPQ